MRDRWPAGSPSGGLLQDRCFRPLCGALSTSIALIAGFLARLAGAHPATAVLRGGAAFASALGLAILILTALRAL